MTERKTMHYALEVLTLYCEWESCTETASDIKDFVSHINKDHLVNLTEGIIIEIKISSFCV